MTSIVTNNAAMTALQSLTQTMKNMETTQSRISTGLRVSSASDNAAYWSIATTMRSDNSALSTVRDALNLGATTIDVSNTGLKSAIDVTSQIKAKLVAAAQPGVDRTKIQSEITQLQKQLKSVADSAVFSGQNWLSVDSGAAGYNSTKSVVSSYQHDAAGSVSVGTISLDTSSVKLFDATLASFTTAANVSTQTQSNTSGTAGTTYTYDAGSGSIKLTYVDDDATYTGNKIKNTTTIANVNAVSPTDVATVRTDNQASGTLGTTSVYNSGAKTLTVTTVVEDATNAGKFVSNVTTISNFVPRSGGGTLDRVDNSTVGKYTDAAGVTTTSAATGTGASIYSLDISTLTDSATDLAKLNALTKQTDSAIATMTSASSNLGSVKSRVSLQQSFVSSLMASIDKGIGALVDADMNEESTKLQALQVQQQLGVQALSLANQSSQTILSLFRG